MIAFLMDVHVRMEVTGGLRRLGVDVVTAQEDGSGRLADPKLLDRAGTLRRVLFRQDADHLREARRRQQNGIEFAGVVYAHQLGVTIGQCVSDLHLIAEIFDPVDMRNRVEYPPFS